jgi:hypothetical protein
VRPRPEGGLDVVVELPSSHAAAVEPEVGYAHAT